MKRITGLAHPGASAVGVGLMCFVIAHAPAGGGPGDNVTEILGEHVLIVGSTARYRSVGAALDAAQPGEVVYVTPGIYEEEYLVLPPDVDLIGLSSHLCVIAGATPGGGETLLAQGRNLIRGLTIENNGGTGCDGVLVSTGADIVVSGCVLSADDNSIKVEGTAGRVLIETCRVDVRETGIKAQGALTIVRHCTAVGPATTGISAAFIDAGSLKGSVIVHGNTVALDPGTATSLAFLRSVGNASIASSANMVRLAGGAPTWAFEAGGPPLTSAVFYSSGDTFVLEGRSDVAVRNNGGTNIFTLEGGSAWTLDPQGAQNAVWQVRTW